ncbi:MAG TPA: hypothetical protein VKR06_37085 [Ktedonosporobacter sp.]|nr:hypothetical protein [Ktedonosporobacter sp.]
MLITVQHQLTSPPGIVVDLAGSPHSLDLAEHATPVIDGRQVARMSCQAEVVTFYFQPPGEAPVACSPATLWGAIAGPGVEASARDAGYLLALVLASRLTIRHIQRQGSQYLDGNALVLPPYREQFDPFSEEYLARCSGSIEDLEAIARVSDLPMERLLLWGTQHDKAWPASPAITQPLQGEEAAPHQDNEVTSSPAPSETEAGSGASEATASSKQYFYWSDDRIQALTEAFFKSAATNVHAACVVIAEQFGWPTKKVEYKVYHLKLPEQKLQQEQSKVAGSSPARDSERVATSEAGIPGVEEAASLGTPAIPLADGPIELEVGPHVWTVRVDGSELPKQWRLRYPYRDFPEQLQGKEVLYAGARYQILGVYTSQLNVGSQGSAAS